MCELPLSRKKGFSKKALSARLRDAGIDLHLRELGNPKPGRDAARRGDTGNFRQIFDEQLASKPAQAALAQAVEVALHSRACLLCFEREPAACHRSIVAEETVSRQGFSLHHLRVKT